MLKEGPDMLKAKEHRQFRWSRCTRTGKKANRSSKNRALFVNTESEQVLQVTRSCTSMYVTQLVVENRTERSGCTAKVWAGEHRCCRDTGGWQTFASTVGRQFMIQREHLDNISRMTSTLQPCSARGTFSAFLFSPLKSCTQPTDSAVKRQ